MFFVYVLRSKSNGKLYTGQTADILTRLEKHQTGLSPSTKGKGPWDLVHSEAFASRAGAMQRERELKTGKGREELKRILAGRSSG